MPWSKETHWPLYYKLPDGLAEQYLARLGLPQKAPSKAYLDELVRQNQLVIPFENLDSTDLGRPVSIEPPALVQKLLVQRRGGYCFELNGLFYLLLLALGFDAWLCPCRQLRHGEPCPVPVTHCGLLVYVEGEALFCDVGYGGPAPLTSIRLQPGVDQVVAGETYRLEESPIAPGDPRSRKGQSGWLVLLKISATAAPLPVMMVAPIQCYLADFYGQNLLRSHGPASYCVRHVSRRTQQGYVDITGDVLTIKEAGVRTRRTFSGEELPGLLRQYFGICLPSPLPLCPKM